MTREQTIKAIREAVNGMRKYNNGVCGYVNINRLHITFLNVYNKPILFFEFDKEVLYIWNDSNNNYLRNIVMSIQYENIKEIF